MYAKHSEIYHMTMRGHSKTVWLQWYNACQYIVFKMNTIFIYPQKRHIPAASLNFSSKPTICLDLLPWLISPKNYKFGIGRSFHGSYSAFSIWLNGSKDSWSVYSKSILYLEANPCCGLQISPYLVINS